MSKRSDSVEFMSICENFERAIGTMTLESSIYEDGYVVVTLLDQFGFEIASIDATSREDNSIEVMSHLEGVLLEQYYSE